MIPTSQAPEYEASTDSDSDSDSELSRIFREDARDELSRRLRDKDYESSSDSDSSFTRRLRKIDREYESLSDSESPLNPPQIIKECRREALCTTEETQTASVEVPERPITIGNIEHQSELTAKHRMDRFRLLRFKLQRGLLPDGGQPKADEIGQMLSFLTELENDETISKNDLILTRLYKLLSHVKRSTDIPEFLRERATRLHEKWSIIWNKKIPPAPSSNAMGLNTTSCSEKPSGFTQHQLDPLSTLITDREHAITTKADKHSQRTGSSTKKRKRSKVVDNEGTWKSSPRAKRNTRNDASQRRNPPRTSPQQYRTYENLFLSQSMSGLIKMLEKADKEINAIERKQIKLLEENATEMKAAMERRDDLVSLKQTFVIWGAQDDKVSDEWAPL